MADTRSAAGEGSERSGKPKVPAQDQSAHELARLIAESDAKGKGFWRRRKRKAASTPAAAPTAAPTPAEPAESVAPATDKPTEPATTTEATALKPASNGDNQPADKPAGQPTADKPAGEPTADKAAGESTADKSAGEPTAETPAEELTADKPAGEPTLGKAAEESTADKSAEESTADKAAEELTAEKAAAERSTADEASVGEGSAEESSATESSVEEPSADRASAVELPADQLSAEMTTDQPSAEEPAAGAAEVPVPAEQPTENPRPMVGVVYEPEESSDGFPLEYGEIIIGLPKKPGAQDEPNAEATEDQPATEAAADKPDPEAAANEPQPDAATDEPHPESATDQQQPEAATDEPQPESDAEAQQPESGADESQPEADDQATEPVAEAVGSPATENADDADEPSEPAEPAAAAIQETDAALAVQAKSDVAQEADAESASDDNATPVGAEDQHEADAAGSETEAPADTEREVPADGETETATDVEPDAEAVPAAEHDADADTDATVGADAHAEADLGEGDSADELDAEDSSSEEDTGSEGSADSAATDEATTDSSTSETDSDSDGSANSETDGDSDDSADAAPDDNSTATDATAETSDADSTATADSGETSEADTTADAEAALEDASEADTAADDEVTSEVAVAPEKSVEEVATEQAAMALITALMKLRGALAASRLPIDVVGADEARQQQKAMLDQLDDYILPRLVQLEAPVLAVVGGSTGAGKSTLVNSLIGKVVSEPGVLRPTTRSPVLIHHPADAEWFTNDRVLPGMARSSGDSPGGTEDPGQIRLVAADTIPQGLAILDAPDIDSVVEANRDLATQLLAAADLWLFVTTAARYADAVPWEFLQSASDRSTAVAVVLDRAPADTIDDITGHLAQMLLERGLGDSPLFSIKETVVDGNGMLASEIVASIKDWLMDLAADAEARSAVVRRTLQGAVTAMTKKTPAFAKAVRAQADTAVELRTTAETAYERAVKDIAKATQDGTMLRGEVLARWQEFVGTGELLKGLQTNVGRLRDKVLTAVVGKAPPTRDLKDAVESGLESLLREHAEAAAERAEESWQSTAAGRQLLATGDRDMGRMSKEFPAEAGRAVREWQGFVLDLVRQEGAEKRSAARILAYGVNGLGLALMVVIFASTAGITGAEVGVGAGTAVVGQKLLEAVFGDQAVRTLAAKARDDLDARVHALMDAEFARYLAVLDQHPVDPDAPRQLTEAARAVEDCT
ncbi:dynamin family protein [Kribbella catacumbae]|uniref:dynamin family protein n=1 Tax=Kribbella catacumbae TaxID=460086 RepID=UPI000362782C|nr:dynamin family protein [Kribbella catacumbae]